jgi:MFS family permease
VSSTRNASLAAAVCLLGDSALYVALPDRGTELGLSPLEIGVLLAANRLVRLAFNGPVGRFVERRGARGALVTATVLSALTTATYGLFPRSFAILLAARVVWGLAWSVLRLSAFVTITAGAIEKRGTLMGAFNAVSRAGSLVAVLSAGVLLPRVGFENLFFLHALATLAAVPLALATFAAGTPPLPQAARREGAPGLVPLLLAGTIVALVGPGLLTTSAGAHVKALGAPVIVTGLVLGGRWGGSIVFAVLAGSLADRFGRARVALAGGALSVVALAVASGGGLELFATSAVLAFVALAGLQAATDALAQDLAGRASSAVAALQRYADAQDVGSAVGSVALGLTDPRIGLDLATLYAGSAGAIVVATALALAVARNLDPRR